MSDAPALTEAAPPPAPAAAPASETPAVHIAGPLLDLLKEKAPELREMIDHLPQLIADNLKKAEAAPAAGDVLIAAGKVVTPVPEPVARAIAAAFPMLPPSIFAKAGEFGAFFEDQLTKLLRREGGYSDDPDDKGGATNFGITIGMLSDVLRRKATKQEIAALTIEAARWIYFHHVFTPIRAGEMPVELATQVFDLAVNSGGRLAAKMLQRALSKTAGIAMKVDGVVGPQTVGTIGKLTPDGIDHVMASMMAERCSLIHRITNAWKFEGGLLKRVALVFLDGARLAVKVRYGVSL